MSTRQPAVVAGLVLALTAALAACSGGARSHRPEVKPTVKIGARATSPTGGIATPAQVADAVNIIRQRLRSAGIPTQVTAQGADLRIVASGSDRGLTAALVTQVGVLRFRQVLGVAAGTGVGSSRRLPVEGSWSASAPTAQHVFRSYDCGYGSAPTLGLDHPSDYIVACDKPGEIKYLLAPSDLGAAQIAAANAVVNTQDNEWLVQLGFSSAGSSNWYALTKRAYEADPSQASSTCQQVDIERGCNEIAITLDGTVLSAPSSEEDGIQGGQTQVTGAFTEKYAQALADLLKTRPLPVHVVIQTTSS